MNHLSASLKFQNEPRFATSSNWLWIPTLLIILNFFPLICLLLVCFQCPASFRSYNILNNLILYPVILWLILKFKKKPVWILCGSILIIFNIAAFFQGFHDFNFLEGIIYSFIFLVGFSLILLPNLNIYLGLDQKLLRNPFGSYQLFPIDQSIQDKKSVINSPDNLNRALEQLVFHSLFTFKNLQQKASYFIGPDRMGYSHQSQLINQPFITWNRGLKSFRSKTETLALFCFDENINIKWMYKVPYEDEKRMTFVSCHFDEKSNVYFIMKKDQNILIYSLSCEGNVRWEKEFSSNPLIADFCPSGITVCDRFLVGVKLIENILITCISSRGNTLWEQVIENKNNLASRYIIDPDSNFIIGLSSETSILQSFDKDGNKLWEQTVTGPIF